MSTNNENGSNNPAPSGFSGFKIGFKFNKSIKPKSVVQPLRMTVDESGEKDKVEFVTSIDDKGIKGSGGSSLSSNAEPGELVIPLIKVNKYKNKRKIDDKPNDLVPKNEDDITSQAKKELLDEAKKLKNGTEDDSVPAWKLMIINKVPNEYESDEKLDVSLRPEESSLDDYENIPIEGFGAAMLRGMGWKKGEAIGGVNKAITPIFEPNLRAKGLGLGADTSIEKQLKATQITKK